MALNKEERRQLNDTHEKVTKLSVVLLGADGDEGLVGEFKREREAKEKQERRISKVERSISRIYGGAAVVAGIIAIITVICKLAGVF